MNRVLLTTLDTYDDQKMDDLHMALRLRHHMKHGASLAEARNKTYQDLVVHPDILSHYAARGRTNKSRVIESFDVMEILQGIGSAAFDKCKNDFGSCVNIAGKVYSTSKCLFTGGGISGAIIVATKGEDCPKGSKKAAGDAESAKLAEALAVTKNETCYTASSTFKDKDGKIIPFYSSKSHPATSWDEPYKWTPPVNCGCWESGAYSWDAPTSTTAGSWVTPSKCGK